MRDVWRRDLRFRRELPELCAGLRFVHEHQMHAGRHMLYRGRSVCAQGFAVRHLEAEQDLRLQRYRQRFGRDAELQGRRLCWNVDALFDQLELRGAKS